MSRSLILAKGLHPSWASGEASYAYGVLKSLLLLEDEIHVISSIDKRRQTTADGYDLERFNNLIKNNKIVYKNLVDNDISTHKITTILEREVVKFDTVHIIYPSILPSRLKGIGKKYIKYIYTPSLTTINEFISSLTYKIELFLSKNIYFAFTTDYLANKYRMSNNHNKIIIPPPIDLDLFKKMNNVNLEEIINYLSSAKYKMGIEYLFDKKSNILLYLGLLLEERFPYKDILKAYQKLLKSDDAFLLIIGREWDIGEEANAKRLITYANQLGIPNKNIGIVLKELNEYIKVSILSISNILLLPLLNKRLSIPIVDPPIIMLEGMALENVIVASNFASISRFISDGYTGFLLNKMDVDEIYIKIKRALDLKDSIGKEAAKLVRKNFSIQNISDTLKGIHL